MQRPVAVEQVEVIEQGATPVNSLGPYSCGRPTNVGGIEAWD